MATLTAVQLRDGAMLMLESRGAILDAARDVTRVLVKYGIPGGIVGGVAIYLHGHVRATTEVDVYVPEFEADEFAGRLVQRGAETPGDPNAASLFYRGVPIWFDPLEDVPEPPGEFVTISGIRTVTLSALIAIQLRRGTRGLRPHSELADVIDLIRANGLRPAFADQLARPLRDEFRRLARAVRGELRRPKNDDPYDPIG